MQVDPFLKAFSFYFLCFLRFFFFFLFLMEKGDKSLENTFSNSERRVKHPFAGPNTQQILSYIIKLYWTLINLTPRLWKHFWQRQLCWNLSLCHCLSRFWSNHCFKCVIHTGRAFDEEKKKGERDEWMNEWMKVLFS